MIVNGFLSDGQRIFNADRANIKTQAETRVVKEKARVFAAWMGRGSRQPRYAPQRMTLRPPRACGSTVFSDNGIRRNA
ncbi:MAG: hypothetical protein LBD58_10870 [Treponema sp.]|jgi:hypothetical protein|nr:hypothetical protein [Treponema sp.]